MKEGGREYRSHSRLDSLDSRTDSLADFAQHFDENLQIDRFYPLLFLFFFERKFHGVWRRDSKRDKTNMKYSSCLHFPYTILHTSDAS